MIGLILWSTDIYAETEAPSLEGSLKQSLTNFRKSVEELKKNNDLLREQIKALRLEALKFQETLKSLSSEEPTRQREEFQGLEKTIRELKEKENHLMEELSHRQTAAEGLKQEYHQLNEPLAAIEHNANPLQRSRKVDPKSLSGKREQLKKEYLKGNQELDVLLNEEKTLQQEISRIEQPRDQKLMALEKEIQDLRSKGEAFASALTQIRQSFDEDEFLSARSLRDEKKLQETLDLLQKENEVLTEKLLRLLMQTRNGLDR